MDHLATGYSITAIRGVGKTGVTRYRPIRTEVTQLRNNYDKGAAGVFNGTVGIVTAISMEEQTLTVLTDEDESLDYDFAPTSSGKSSSTCSART